jgi:hypothetical protein
MRAEKRFNSSSLSFTKNIAKPALKEYNEREKN